MNIKQLFEKTSNGFKEFVAKVEMSNVVGLVEELTKYIKKGDSDQTFILDNGERTSAIVDVDDEVDYADDCANISLISSNSEYIPTIHLNSATNSEAGLMSAVDKRKLDNAVENDGEASISAINHMQSIDGDETEGLNINNVNGISSLDGGNNIEFWNTKGGKTNVGKSGLTTNGDIKIEGDNNITTVNKDGSILIYNKNKGINTIDINGNDASITLNNVSKIQYYTDGVKLNSIYTNRLYITKGTTGTFASLMCYNDGLHINQQIFAQGLKVADNQEASFGNRGILLNGGGIDFKYSTNEAHFVHTKALGLGYDGVACKENFYVKDNIYTDNVVYANAIDSNLIDHVETLRFGGEDRETELTYDVDADVLDINSNINVTGYIKGLEYYILKNHAINFVYNGTKGDKETSISADVNSGHIIVNNAIECNKHITCDGIYSDSTISVTSDKTKSGVLRSNGLYFDDTETENDMSITANVNNNLFMFDRQIQIDINDTVLSTLNENSITFYDKQIDDTFSIAYDKDCQCIVTDSNFKFYNTVNIANAITLNDNDNKAIVIYNNTDNYSETNTSKSDSINLDYSSSSLKANTLIEANAITINYNDVNYSDKYNAVYREKQMSLKREHDGNIYNTLIAPNNIKCYIGNSININCTEFNNLGYYIHGENNYNQTSLTYNLNLNTKDDFNGISKAVYSANSISISNTDSDGVRTNTIELSAIDNSIRFITKTLSDNKTTTYKFNVQKAIELGLLTKE